MSVEEHFLGLFETASLTGETIFELVRDALCRFNLSLGNLRGQCYDVGSNMSGINKGVQKIMLDLQPIATYAHCSNNSLNLAQQDSVRAVPLIRDCMQWVNYVGVLVRQSPKRRSRFEELVREKQFVTISNPRILCPTRWCVRTAALDVMLEAYPHILELLGEITCSKDSGNEAASKARGLSDQLSKVEIYLGIAICCRVFGPSE
ncbi:hypothetical protein PR048_028534 [Dryococelus australis]|uniref:DUF4371 domain-containing protein n=1 Tax=Dryococelus australis TaxID=614101 RepID=A0ABQ9GAV1_9NEOP|nr:hypothetical protein PR048_028534 [Dryococelus australis]